MFFYNVTIFLRCVVCDNGGMKEVDGFKCIKTVPGAMYAITVSKVTYVYDADLTRVIARCDPEVEYQHTFVAISNCVYLSCEEDPEVDAIMVL